MWRCVQGLISNGASVEALRYNSKKEFEGAAREREIKVSWNETPLDSAIDSRNRRIKKMEGNSIFTLEDNEGWLRRMDSIFLILKQAGAVSVAHKVERREFIFDAAKYGKGGDAKAKAKAFRDF
ncbi:hypothetical protein K402DRAFT_395763 [Aulographum hederae CBS 113979]|uniref:Uncharacterized protein n=1 Tax=Aulographum hederae CBS 113979 TaxID=1176131 RepID=A0A6G1GUD8_9PEZI|nr:hypothetical protein K402DRAFT_395763 [Aulographum hederae CBS 113979]